MPTTYRRIAIIKGNPVQLRYFSAGLVLCLLAMLAPIGSARADTVLYNGAGFIQGQQSFVKSFDITTPGTLTVSLSNIPWMDTISDLNCFLTSSSGLMGPASVTSGTETMFVQPGMVYAHWFGDAKGVFGIGVYGLDVTFSPSSVETVGLPGSLILMLSGLGLLFGWQRRAAPKFEAAA